MIEFTQQFFEFFQTKVSLLPTTLLQVGSALAKSTGEVRSIVKTVISWASMIMGAVGFIQCILIFTSSGQGEDKLKKQELGCLWLYFVL